MTLMPLNETLRTHSVCSQGLQLVFMHYGMFLFSPRLYLASLSNCLHFGLQVSASDVKTHPYGNDLLSCVRSNIYCCCLVAKSCLTLCDPMDCSLPSSSVHGIFQATVLERIAIWVTGPKWQKLHKTIRRREGLSISTTIYITNELCCYIAEIKPKL